MEAAFWHGVWERNTIGFHQDSIHPFLSGALEKHLLQDKIARKSKSDLQRAVFVPLCGKSLDMFWWAERAKVVGNELSGIACRDFFTEQSLDYTSHQAGKFTVYSYEEITLYQGDFFSLKADELPSFTYIYDRAALIALPEAMQQAYCDHLSSFIEDGTTLYLISVEFPEEELKGPPFPIVSKDVESLFSGFDIELVAERDVPNKQFARRTFDVSFLKEKLYAIKKAL
ncbi:thiopurine S-methyltransferase [Thalassotalea euphylliae]|uniref:thiopurine S-methyltransferase n=1 Tax=Thalassotalea euphylliae TaxID=1655234 RepID=UPI00363DAD4F